MNWENLIKKVDWEVKRGEGEYDDYPDHVNFYLDGKKVWEDDHAGLANDAVIYNCMLDSFKCDMFKLKGKYHSEWVA